MQVIIRAKIVSEYLFTFLFLLDAIPATAASSSHVGVLRGGIRGRGALWTSGRSLARVLRKASGRGRSGDLGDDCGRVGGHRDALEDGEDEAFLDLVFLLPPQPQGGVPACVMSRGRLLVVERARVPQEAEEDTRPQNGAAAGRSESRDG